MSAANRIHRKSVFSCSKIRATQRSNKRGYFTPTIILKSNRTVQGVPYKRGTKLSFHINGQVVLGTLAKNSTIKVLKNKVPFKAGTLITFSKYGNVEAGTLVRMTAVNTSCRLRGQRQTIALKRDTLVQFSGGCFAQGVLSQSLNHRLGRLKALPSSQALEWFMGMANCLMRG